MNIRSSILSVLVLCLSFSSCGDKEEAGQASEPEVLSTVHTGCAQNRTSDGTSDTKSETFPVGTLTVSYSGGEVLMNHENCTVNCSITDGDVFIPKVSFSDGVFEVSNRLERSDMRCMCPVESVLLRIGGVREGAFTLRYNFCGTAFTDIPLNLSEGSSQTIDLTRYLQ